MDDAMLQAEIVHVKGIYGDVAMANEPNGTMLLRTKDIALPRGCAPTTTPVLLRLQPGQARPEVFVKPGIRLSNGKEPRSTSTVQVGGESWLQFSYAFAWDPLQHSLAQFIETALQRFAKLE